MRDTYEREYRVHPLRLRVLETGNSIGCQRWTRVDSSLDSKERERRRRTNYTECSRVGHSIGCCSTHPPPPPSLTSFACLPSATPLPLPSISLEAIAPYGTAARLSAPPTTSHKIYGLMYRKKYTTGAMCLYGERV